MPRARSRYFSSERLAEWRKWAAELSGDKPDRNLRDSLVMLQAALYHNTRDLRTIADASSVDLFRVNRWIEKLRANGIWLPDGTWIFDYPTHPKEWTAAEWSIQFVMWSLVLTGDVYRTGDGEYGIKERVVDSST